MYNPKLTTEPFDGSLTVKRGHRLITDAQDKVLGMLSKKEVCDLNGKQIATLDRIERTVHAEGKKQKTRIYRGECGEMRLRNGVLFAGESPIGKIPERERNALHIVLLSAATLMLLAVIAFIFLIDIPFADTPIIAITRFVQSPVSEMADLKLYTAANESVFRSGAMSSRLSQLNIIDILYTALANDSYEQTLDQLSRTHIHKPGNGIG